MLFPHPLFWRCTAIIFAIISHASGLSIASAQLSDTLSESEFWSLVSQTDRVLQNADSANGENTRLRGLWVNVNAVWLDDGTQIPVDMAWLTVGLEETDPTERQKLRTRVAALLDYRTYQVLGAGTGDPLNTLDRVLQDPRFRYDDVTPTPPPQTQPEDFDLPDIPQPGVGVSQIVLMLGGVILVFLFVVYFARGLRIQGAGSDKSPEPDQEPQTSLHAEALASTSETVHDYRAAVRYLYLSSLLLLDERGLIRYDRTLTNREHLQQIADKPQLLELLRPVIGTFDRVWYGFAPLDEILYQEFRHNVERLRELAR